MENCCVYWIHLPEHSDIFKEGYVGITKNIEKRINDHKKYSKNYHLKNAFKKHDNMIVTVVFEGNRNDCYMIENLLRNVDKIGWNIAKGGLFLSKLAKKAQIEKIKGVALTQEHKNNISIGLKQSNHPLHGSFHTEESKKKMSDSHKNKPSNFKGLKMSEESRKKISETRKNNPKVRELSSNAGKISV